MGSMIVILLMSCFFSVFLVSNFRIDRTADGDDLEGLQYVSAPRRLTKNITETSTVKKEDSPLFLATTEKVEKAEVNVVEKKAEESLLEKGKKELEEVKEKVNKSLALKKGSISKVLERFSKTPRKEENVSKQVEENKSDKKKAANDERVEVKKDVEVKKNVEVDKARQSSSLVVNKKKSEEVKDVPRNGDSGSAKLTLFSLADCKGESIVFEQNNKEKNCENCIDFCGKNFPLSKKEGTEVKSILLEGNESVIVSLHQHCAGTWAYPSLGFHSFVFEGCQNTAAPAHAIFHALPFPLTEKGSALSSNVAHKKMIRFPKSAVFGYMKYYERFPLGPDAFLYERDEDNPRYVTFNSDCGGWNNIRMGFEHAVLMAWTTNRTLVMPPSLPFYLIDFGPFAFEKPGTGFSHFGDFFNLELLQQLPAGWISTSEFYRREKTRFGIPARFDKYASENATWPKDGDKDWLGWLGQMFGAVPAGPDRNVIMEPNPETYLASDNNNPRAYGTKKHRTLDSEVPVLHFPACQKPHEDFRYLGQISTAVLYADVEREKAFHQFWRAAVVYSEDIFKVASAVIAELGLFNFTSLHVRRNELQYEDSFQDSASTLRNIDHLLYPNEVIYLATDESKDPHFFDALRAKHPIFTWKDFYDDKTEKLKFNGMPVRRKVINCIEQVICAGGRRFFGTVHSTFSSYIFRLRGYVGAPDTEQRHHNVRYTGLESIDFLSREPMDGYTYMKEDPRMWEVI